MLIVLAKEERNSEHSKDMKLYNLPVYKLKFNFIGHTKHVFAPESAPYKYI